MKNTRKQIFELEKNDRALHIMSETGSMLKDYETAQTLTEYAICYELELLMPGDEVLSITSQMITKGWKMREGPQKQGVIQD